MISPEYAAGFFDGEGCVNMTPSGKRGLLTLRVMLTNTDLGIISAFCVQFGGHIAAHHHRNPKWKTGYRLNLTGHMGAAFLRYVAPYVRVKAAQVTVGLEFWALKQLPKSERCDYTKHGLTGRGGGAVGRVKSSMIEAESGMRSRLQLLNRKGA